MKFFWKVCQMDVVGKHTFSFFIVKKINFKKAENMFEHMEMSETIYEDVVETS